MSWSFRKDCIGFAKSILDPTRESTTRNVEKKEESEEESLNYLLCVLIGYFVSTVSHDIDEWLTWGVPYVDICVDALKLDPSLTGKIRDRFVGTVGRGYLFVFEDEGCGETDGWTHVTPLASFLASIGEKLAVYERQEGGVQVVLDGFLGAMRVAVARGKYDTRTRVLISRRICHMFQLQSQQQLPTSPLSPSDQATTTCIDTEANTDAIPQCCTNDSTSSSIPSEQEAFQNALLSNLSGVPSSSRPTAPATSSLTSFFHKSSGGRDEQEGETAVVVPSFRTAVAPQQVASAVNSFRALKVGVAAASGGALMFCAGGLAAPSIVTSLVASLTGMTSAGSTSAVLMDLGVLLNTYGLPVITSAATTLGTSMASWKMMRRTDPLKEFVLEPLHAPHTRDLSKNTILVAAPEGYIRKDAPDASSSSATTSSTALSLFQRMLPSPPTSSIDNTGPMTASPSIPAEVVFLLVPGHFSSAEDLREVWGGDNDLETGHELREGADGSGSSDGFKFSCREVDSKGDDKKGKMGTDTTGAASSAGVSAGKKRDENNIRRGWWREVVGGRCDGNSRGSGGNSSDGGRCESMATDGSGGGEPYVVRWDTIELTRLFHAQQSFVLEKSVSLAVEELLKFASPVIGAAALPLTVLEQASELDCPWLVVMDRAEQAGRLLAALLLENAAAPRLSSDKEHQQYRQRSVSLIGYGFGARVIMHCLLLLSEAPDRAGLGIVQDVVLIGAPVSSSSVDWLRIRKVVSGRVVNCYKTDDWMLGVMWRSKAWQVGVAGLGPVMLQGDSDPMDSAQEQQQKEEEAEEGSTWRHSSPKDNSGNGSGEKDRERKGKAGLMLSLRAHDPAWRTGVENIDISDLVPSHLQYAESLRPVLQRVGLS